MGDNMKTTTKNNEMDPISYYEKVTVTVYVPKHIEDPETFIQARINNFKYYEEGLDPDNKKIKPSDIDGVIHLTDYRKRQENFLYIENKMGDAPLPKAQEILLKAITKQKNNYAMIVHYEEDDILQLNPYKLQTVKNGEIGKEMHTSAENQALLVSKWKKSLGR